MPWQRTHDQLSTSLGFSLIELSIVLIIMGLIMGTTLQLISIRSKNHYRQETQDHLYKAQIALKTFVEVNGFYPCPASRNARRGQTGFGKALKQCKSGSDASSFGDNGQLPDVSSAVGRDYKNVRIGILPFRSLGLADSAATDAWGNIMQYAVSESLTSFDSYDQREGAIDIVAEDRQSRLVPPMTGQYVVWSGGEDGKGGYSGDLAPLTPCPAETLEGENCDGDAVFMDTQKNAGGGQASYDDYLVYQQYDPLEANHGGLNYFYYGECGAGFTPVDMDGFDISTFNAGSIVTLSKKPAGNEELQKILCHSTHYSAGIMIQVQNSDTNPALCPTGWSNIGYQVFGGGDAGIVYKICAR